MAKVISSNSIGNPWKSDANVKPNDRRTHNLKTTKTKGGSKKK